MLPKSYDKVPEGTKQTVQLFIARASGFLQGKGQSDQEVRTNVDKIENEAIKEAVEIAVEVWNTSHQPCTAEQFVQRFAGLVWEATTGDDERDWPYEFKAPVDDGPLSTEFLEAVGITEEEARGNPQVKKEQDSENEQTLEKEQSPEKRQSPDKQQIPGQVAKLPLYPKPVPEPATMKSAILNLISAKFRERKTDGPQITASKLRCGNNGQRIPSGFSANIPTHVEWSGLPLTDYQVKLMNAGLMEAIWEARIYNGDNIYHDAGVFAVKIPKDKAWLLLGKDIISVFGLIRKRWHPLRLHTCDLGHSLQVGLWVKQSKSQGEMEEKVRYKSEELYNLLRLWSFQVQGSGTQSLANCLQGYFNHLVGR